MPSTSSARPLFLTDDPALLDDLLRLAAAANVDVTVVSSAARSSRYWAQAPLVVVGTDLVGVLARAEPPRHAHAVVVSRTPLSPALDFSVYPDAMRIGARDVLVLPDAEQQLVALLTESTDHAGEEALVVSVIGGRGGPEQACSPRHSRSPGTVPDCAPHWSTPIRSAEDSTSCWVPSMCPDPAGRSSATDRDACSGQHSATRCPTSTVFPW